MEELVEKKIDASVSLRQKENSSPDSSLNGLNLPAAESGISKDVPQTLTGPQMRNTLSGYHADIGETDRSKYSSPTISAGVLSDNAIRHFDTENRIGVSISSAQYAPNREVPGSYKLKSVPDEENIDNKEVKVNVYTKRNQNSWGEGERERTYYVNRNELAGKVEEIEQAIQAGTIEKTFNREYKRDEQTGRLVLTPIEP